MSTWKQDHLQDLVERQAHISQKLAQLGRIRTTLGDMATRIPQMQAWLESMQKGPDGSIKGPVDLFNPEIFIRMGSIAVFIRTVFASLLAAGSEGAQTTSTGAGADDGRAAQAAFAGQAAGVLDAAGPLGTQVDLSSFVDQFGVTNKLREDGLGWTMLSELWALLTSPFETYQRHKFSHMALDLYEDLLQDHGDDLLELGTSLRSALSALQQLQNALNIAGVEDATSTLGGGAETELREVLRLMEQTYEAAGGTGPTLAELREMATQPPDFIDVSLDSMVAGDGSSQWAAGAGFSPPPGFGDCGSWDVQGGLGSSQPCPFESSGSSGMLAPGEPEPAPGQTPWVKGTRPEDMGEWDPGTGTVDLPADDAPYE
jgi:hypothetical protein